MKPFVFRQSDKAVVMRRVEYLLSALRPNKQYQLEIKEHRNRRSLDANAYFWVLAHKLAEATEIPVGDIYRNAIKEIGGVSEHYCGKPEAIERLCAAWRGRGLGWMAETYESKLPGMENAILYYGSSTYDTKQMSRLIDNIVQDCRALDIETEPPERLAAMMEAWDAQTDKGDIDTAQGEGSRMGA